jgi:hypothetical protein
VTCTDAFRETTGFLDEHAEPFSTVMGKFLIEFAEQRVARRYIIGLLVLQQMIRGGDNEFSI